MIPIDSKIRILLLYKNDYTFVNSDSIQLKLLIQVGNTQIKLRYSIIIQKGENWSQMVTFGYVYSTIGTLKYLVMKIEEWPSTA